TCLTANDAHPSLATKRHHAEIMLRFEDALAAHVDRQPGVTALCAAIGVPERTLQACCVEFLGMSPSRYLRLRRLNMVRAALRRADPATASVAEIAQHYQFSDLGRFAAVYRAIFGEMPSATLRHTAIKRRKTISKTTRDATRGGQSLTLLRQRKSSKTHFWGEWHTQHCVT